MKRDMELVRSILFAVESSEGGNAPNPLLVDGHIQGEINYHIFIMIEAGLLEGCEVTHMQSPGPEAIATRMTWAGHEFLDVARDESRWKSAMSMVKEKGGTITIGVLAGLLTGLMKKAFHIP